METATLTSSQVEYSQTAYSSLSLINRLFFSNESFVKRNTKHLSAMVFTSICLFMIGTAFGIFAFYQEFNDILLNPLYNPIAYGAFFVLNGWLLFSAVVYLYKLNLYLKNKSSEFATEENENIVINKVAVSEVAGSVIETEHTLINPIKTFIEKFNASITQAILTTKSVIVTRISVAHNNGKVLLDQVESYFINLDKELKQGLDIRAFNDLHFK
ncbi:hypothetical protein ACJOV8_004860 [Formosa sp. 3Alg 14/1]|uniref:hypothetical protein n=1 Tax=Formosa sp. 3Alg 14/1 TaxID=3382190 RepID=UPI0039BE5050